ncbi:MAG: head GIN domain-containing protein [Draconibacterium sp.]
MKRRILVLAIVLLGISMLNPLLAEDQERDVPSFSKISLRISGNLYLKQGEKQSVKIVAKESTLEDIITEVKDRTLNIRFPSNFVFKKYDPGKIDIYVTVPEVDGLSISGSGDILAENINTRILDLAVSGSGDIKIGELSSERISGSISGSGNVRIEKGGVADELSVSISGSGGFDAAEYEADDVIVRISGSGNCKITTNGSIKARIAGSGNVYYSGNPSIDSSVAGSGKVREM